MFGMKQVRNKQVGHLRGESFFSFLFWDLQYWTMFRTRDRAILGRGSVLTEKGEVEMDAMMMEGDRLNSGAVACVSSVKNPIKLARSK